MLIKEINMNSGEKYLIGIVDEKKQIKCYILKKRLIGYEKIYCYDTLKTLNPDYDYIVLCTISNYERELKNKEKLIQWSLS